MISIITPTFNRAHLLPRMISSVNNQTYKDWELIIMDDCSTDNTEEVVENFDDPRIKYFPSSENSGAADKRNKGVLKASGEFIIFLDSDDEVENDWLEKMAEPLGKHKNIIVTCTWTKFNHKGEKVEKGPPKDLGRMFGNLELNFLSGCLLYSRSSFLEAGEYDTELSSGQHTELLMRLVPVWQKNQVKVITVPESLVKIHLHKGERIRSNYDGIFRGSTRTLQKHSQLFMQDPKKYYDYSSVAAVCAMRTGRISEGKKYFRQAFRIKPFLIKSYIRILIAYTPVLRKKIWRNNNFSKV